MAGPWVRRGATGLLGVGMIAIGVAHFADPDPFVRIMPPYLPAHLELVLLSGLFEILGGVGVLVPRTRCWAAWGLVALFVAVFPANVHMAVSGAQPFPDAPVSPLAAWLRLPLQGVLVAWAWWVARQDAEGPATR